MAYATIAGSKEMGSRIKNQHMWGQKPGADMKAERQYGQINGRACVKR